MSSFQPKASKEHKGWYEIPGYSKYLANRKGEIMNKKLENPSKGGDAGRYLKTSAYPDGSDKAKLVYVHDLICRAFKGPPKKGQVVLHDDDDRKNNLPGNLKWGTQSENVQAAYDNGLRSSNESLPPSASW